jgi:hypothetical protein
MLVIDRKYILYCSSIGRNSSNKAIQICDNNTWEMYSSIHTTHLFLSQVKHSYSTYLYNTFVLQILTQNMLRSAWNTQCSNTVHVKTQYRAYIFAKMCVISQIVCMCYLGGEVTSTVTPIPVFTTGSLTVITMQDVGHLALDTLSFSPTET